MNLGDQPAFPCQGLGQDGNPEMPLSPGMSTRTWLAGMIAAGNTEALEMLDVKLIVAHADALLAELEKEKPCQTT